ncbi:MAG: MBL fold metallo-hydrolase [Proteobacteria bacterium]|nr:MBL fold metallo-hydrolase [Pseudomonadota bacterium]
MTTLFIKQLLAGRDHASQHPIARQMMNCAYLIGCSKSKECLVVDPSWDPLGTIEIAKKEGYRVVGAIATHGHPDHVGGSWMGFPIPGLSKLMDAIDGPVYVHPVDAPALTKLTGIEETHQKHKLEGDVIKIGDVSIDVLHTPGHTPGHLTFLCEGYLITGDVLFVGGCGRTDLDGSDVRKMGESLLRLRTLPDETIVFPGHHYGPAIQSTIGEEKRTNPTMRFESVDQWMRMMGAH